MSFPAKPIPLALLCALAAVSLAACGGSAAKATATQENEQQLVNFAKCMREHGVNVSTPTGRGGGRIRVTGTNPQTMEAAQKACRRFQPQGLKENLTPAEKAAREDAVLNFARCMRSHGIEIPSPSRGGGGIGIQLKNVNPQSPAFQAAQKACEGLLPRLGLRGRAAGPKPGSGGGPSTGSSAGPASGSPAGSSLSLSAGG
jgi:hypothetical protein